MDCAYVATPTPDPYIELLMHKGETVGIKLSGFCGLPREVRDACLERIGIGLDHVQGIEHLWMHNADEMDEEISAYEIAFCKWPRV